ncbi:hypothetical protein [Streptomyces sp. NPDC054901]
MRRGALVAGAAACGAVVLAGSLTGVAHAAEPAGTGVRIVSAQSSGGTLAWSGSYSCAGGVANTVTVHASDELGHSATGLAVITCLGKVTGASVSGTVSTGLLGLGGSWGNEITLTTTMRGLLGVTLASDQVALAGNRLNKASLEGVTPTPSGLTVSGGFDCETPVGTVTLRLTAADRITGLPLGTTAQTLSCQGNTGTPGSGTWSAALPSASGGASGGTAGGDENLSFSMEGSVAVTIDGQNVARKFSFNGQI